MQYDAGGVNHRLQRSREYAFHFRSDKFFHGFRVDGQRRPIRITRDPCAKVREHRARNFHQQSAIDAPGERREARLEKQFVNRRNLTQQFRLLTRNRAFGPCIHADISAQSSAPGNVGGVSFLAAE